MILSDLIKWLEVQNQDANIPHGFGLGHKHHYENLAFEPAEYVKISAMLTEARKALGISHIDWSGNEHMVTGDTECWVAEKGFSNGTRIGPSLIKMWEWCIMVQCQNWYCGE